MTIVHRDGAIHKNADGLSRWPMPNNPDNPAYDEEIGEDTTPLMNISITDLDKQLFESIKEEYVKNKNTL